MVKWHMTIYIKEVNNLDELDKSFKRHKLPKITRSK